MKNIGIQVGLFATVISVVAFTNLAPCIKMSQPALTPITTDGLYTAPDVPYTNNRSFIDLLKLDLNFVKNVTATSKDRQGVQLSVQSYNVIAAQISPGELKTYRLPLSIN